jgi:hypothetical protein
MIGSAKQSTAPQVEMWDCFVAVVPRNDERKPSRGSFRPSCASSRVPLQEEGAGNTGCTSRTRGSHAKENAAGTPKHRHSLRNGLQLIARSPRCPGFSSHRRLPIIIDKLDLSIGRPGPHAFAVRAGRVRQLRPACPSHPAPNVRDDREAPLWIERGRVINSLTRSAPLLTPGPVSDQPFSFEPLNTLPGLLI